MDTFAYTVNCSILLTDLPLLQRPQAAGTPGSTLSNSGGPSPNRCRRIARSTRSSVLSKTRGCS